MKVQVLVATMHQDGYDLLEKMNIQSDVIVGNQCNRNCIERFEYRGYEAVYLNFAERGVGLNRNNALMRATGDICLFADDDMVYENGYCEMIKTAFLDNPEADVIVFNLNEPVITRKVITKKSRVGYLNYLRYGTARIAVRMESIKKQGIYFNQCFGGGTEHCHGEDNLFLNACIKKGLKIVAVPMYLASLTEERESSWNKGFDRKYLQDQGVLYRILSRRWWRLLCLQDAVRRHKSYDMSWRSAYMLMIRGGDTR